MTYVYDKGKYHDESVLEAGLPEEHASNHTVPILRWLIENNLMSDFFESEGKAALDRYRAGELSIHGLYAWWDRCLASDMLSDAGNAFAMQYFDFDRGEYIADYVATLQGSLPSEFHVSYTEESYARLRSVIDRRYEQWKSASPKSGGRFWK
jgi:hypothetical protein